MAPLLFALFQLTVRSADILLGTAVLVVRIQRLQPRFRQCDQSSRSEVLLGMNLTKFPDVLLFGSDCGPKQRFPHFLFDFHTLSPELHEERPSMSELSTSAWASLMRLLCACMKLALRVSGL